MSAREVLDEIQARVTAATPGPWEVSDANEGMHEYGPMWMVTNDEFHNPSGGEDEPWLAVELHVGDKADAEFIAAAREDVTRLVAALRAVLDNHWCIEGGEECGYDGRIWPCPDYRAITEALGDSPSAPDECQHCACYMHAECCFCDGGVLHR